MKTYFIFRHNFNALTKTNDNLLQEDLFDNLHKNLIPSEGFDDILIGNHCLFKMGMDTPKLQVGRISTKEKLKDTKDYKIINFPRAEYIYTVHKGPYRDIGATYVAIENQLEEKELKPIFDPILVFPNNFPTTKKQEIVIEVWIATNAHTGKDRYSNELDEALPRKEFNFYTW